MSVTKCTRFLKENRDRALVLLCVMAVLFSFAIRKEGLNVDETLSYNLANAEFNPFILPTQPVGRLAKYWKEEIRGGSFLETCSNLADTMKDLAFHRGNSKILNYKADVYPYAIWIAREQFRDYITVTKEDSFQFLSPYFNARTDVHPPLYPIYLHAVSSVLGGVMPPLVGCVANILLILGTCILTMKLGMLLERESVLPDGWGRIGGNCASLLYGLSQGGTASMLLTRMYAMLGFLFVLTFYLHIGRWLRRGFAAKRMPLIAVTISGFLTQYFFLLYCVPLAAVTSALLLARKRHRELWNYVGTMILSAALGMALFPFAVDDVLSSAFSQSVEKNIVAALGEYNERLYQYGHFLLGGFFGNMAAGVAMTAILAVCCAVLALLGKKREKGNERNAVWLIFLIPFAGDFFLTAEMAPWNELRFIMPLFPFVAMLVALACVRIQSSFQKSPRWLVLAPALLLAVSNLAFYSGAFLYTGHKKQLAVAREYASLPCVCVCARDWYYYNVLEFMEYDRTLITDLPELEAVHDLSLLKENQLIVIRKSEMDEGETLRVLDGYGWEADVLLPGNETVFGDTIYLCTKKGTGPATGQ